MPSLKKPITGNFRREAATAYNQNVNAMELHKQQRVT